MKIIPAATAGMCFGVRDALAALEAIERPSAFAIYGELVHNEVVLHQLQAQASSNWRNPSGPRCPPPRTSSSPRTASASTAASNSSRPAKPSSTRRVLWLPARIGPRELASAGAFVVVIGRPDHVEVEGITGDLAAFAVVASVAAVGTYPAARIGVVCQTTFPIDEAAAIRRRIEICNPAAEIHWVDTICQPTKDHQQALLELLEQVPAVVVVGGRHSHNTRRLVETCQHRGRSVLHVQGAADLSAEWFTGLEIVGLTAGTSTLPETIRQVHDRLLEIAAELSSSE